VDVAEVVCGDPTCAPIDTVFTFVWQSGGKGVFAVPMTAAEVTKDELLDNFPVSSFFTQLVSTFTWHERFLSCIIAFYAAESLQHAKNNCNENLCLICVCYRTVCVWFVLMICLVLYLQDEDILRQWHAGKKARWPRLPDLRFQVQDRVECRIGPHPVKGTYCGTWGCTMLLCC
jgi:hypothetical protein